MYGVNQVSKNPNVNACFIISVNYQQYCQNMLNFKMFDNIRINQGAYFILIIFNKEIVNIVNNYFCSIAQRYLLPNVFQTNKINSNFQHCLHKYTSPSQNQQPTINHSHAIKNPYICVSKSHSININQEQNSKIFLIITMPSNALKEFQNSNLIINKYAQHFIGEVYYNLQQYHRGQKCFRNLLDQNPNYYEALFNLGMVLDKINSAEEAIKYFQQAIKISPQRHETYFRLVDIYKAKNNKQKAVAYYLKIIELFPSSYHSYNFLGELFSEGPKFEKAIMYYQKAIDTKLISQSQKCYIQIVKLYQKIYKFQEALNCYLNATKFQPNQQAFILFGKIGSQIRSKKIALQIYNKGLKIYLRSHNLLRSIGKLQLEMGQNRKSTQKFKMLVQMQPLCAQNYDLLGQSLQRQNKIEEATLIYRKALKIDPQNNRAVLHLAGCAYQDGAINEAIDYYQQAIKLNPWMFNLYLRLSQIYNIRRDKEKEFNYILQYLGVVLKYNKVLWFSYFRVYKKQVISQQNKILHKSINKYLVDLQSCFDLGVALKEIDKIQESLVCMQQAVRIQCQIDNILRNLRVELQKLVRFSNEQLQNLKYLWKYWQPKIFLKN